MFRTCSSKEIRSRENRWDPVLPAAVAVRESALRSAHRHAARLTYPRQHAAAAELSRRHKKRSISGRALMTDPKLILLDEPIAGVNPTLANEIGAHLRALRDEGLTFLIIEHHMDVIARLCDPVIVMAEGRHLAEGSFAAIAADARVQAAYMGRRAWAS